ncbi:hypothetical protein VKT23_011822 [Stygiomarasmius scandens]|uniref:Glucose-methanol-choline oxidoreductase N-terminal domain-containing protein n=1 Tax=Marasmiellus scandens TaxID=2682957 RepID=A0ABR1JD74_9AGAR
MWTFSSSITTKTVEYLHDSYDYIVVGGGNAGCVLARRLSENGGNSVLLVERGDAGDGWLHRTPLPSLHQFSDGKHSSVLESAHNTQLGRLSALVTGLGLGGSTRINGGQYTCGIPAQYNSWNKAVVDRKDWSYSDIKQFFKKSETFVGPVPREFHGLDGPLKVSSYENFNFRCAEKTFEAARNIGFPGIEDLRSPLAPCTGVNKMHFTVASDGTRQSAYRAYLPKNFVNAMCDTLHICTKTLARKLYFSTSKDSLNVDTVELQDIGSGQIRRISVKKEVILACGALRTPQLLFLSGVGPRRDLEAQNISVVKDLPGVGQHLLHQYLRHGKGWFLCTMVEMEIFGSSKCIQPDGTPTPLTGSQLDSSDPKNLPDFSVMSCCIADPRGENIDQSRGFLGLNAALLQTKSSGRVQLSSTDPNSNLHCEMNYLDSPEDWKALRAALRVAVRLAEEMRASGYPIEDIPNRVPESLDDDTLNKYIRENADTMFHYSSTCRMAPEDAESPGVVNDELRVHGLTNLRICDASTFPDVPATHPQALVYAFAEKCAAMILEAKLDAC